MSPFRRRKGRSSPARARRRELVERERLTYESERTDAQPQEEAPPQEAEAQPQEAEAQPRPSRERARRRRRRVSRPSFSALRSASTTGARATVRQARPGVGRVSGIVGRSLGWLLAWPLRLAGLIERLLFAIVDALAAAGGRILELAERYATPERVLVLVTGGAAGCLIYSQFVAYRGVEVGQPLYSQVNTIAPPPQTDRVDAGAAHAYVLIPLAVIAVVIAIVALLSGRWRLGRLVSIVGLIGIAISLAIDLPKGLDAGTAGSSFAEANATLTEGFYAQLAASAVLVLCGWVLSINLRRRAGVVEGRGRVRRSRPRARRAASVAGGGA
jgi:hypothetical protein